MAVSRTVAEIYLGNDARYEIIGQKMPNFSHPLVFGTPLGVKPSELSNDPWRRETRMMGLSDVERISMKCLAISPQITPVIHRRTDRQTDGRNSHSSTRA